MFSWYYIEGILIQSCYTLLIVLGLSILTGYTGMFSFGHAGFVCIGAYAENFVGKAGNAYLLPDSVSDVAAGKRDHALSKEEEPKKDRGGDSEYGESEQRRIYSRRSHKIG